jgi:outer membrane biosynthesis protein TonB
MPFGRVAVWRDVERRAPLYISPLMICQTRSMPVVAMVLVATAIAPWLLLGAATPAAAQAKPCRTPCLAVPKPEEKPTPEPAKPPAAVDRPSERAAARPPPKPRAPAEAPPARVAEQEADRPAPARRPAPTKRCTEINMRAAVGEPLSDQDMTYLRSQC